jgi:hypothetical protein
MRKSKRIVEWEGNCYKVKSDKIEIPDFSKMERFSVLQWMCKYTYPRGHSKPNPLAGFGGAISIRVK